VQRGLARLGPGAAAADLHVHEHVQHLARAAHRRGQLADVVGVVHHRERLRVAVEHLEQASDLLRPHHLGGDEEIADPRRRHHLRLRHLGHAHAHRPGRDLTARDLRALVRLRVRAQLFSHRLHMGGHLLDVALEAVEIEEERGRGQLGFRHGVGSIARRRRAGSAAPVLEAHAIG
jgi:hypothetical protein